MLIAVPDGVHRITIVRRHPPLFSTGAVIAVLSCVTLVGCRFLNWRFRSRRGPLQGGPSMSE
jgi:hypothetical protein